MVSKEGTIYLLNIAGHLTFIWACHPADGQGAADKVGRSLCASPYPARCVASTAPRNLLQNEPFWLVKVPSTSVGFATFDHLL